MDEPFPPRPDADGDPPAPAATPAEDRIDGDAPTGFAGPDDPTVDLGGRRAPDAPHPLRIGPFRIEGVLGEGGMGRVYVAEQEHPIRRRVALKVVHGGFESPTALARFEVERQLLARMRHPHVAQVHEAGQTAEGRPWFAMELVEGLPITEWCDAHQVPLRRRIELMLDVCDAVRHAHMRGILHRDLKPANVLMTDDSGPRVIDFGIARPLERSAADPALTRADHVIGTPRYMSPEQAGRTDRDLDVRSDIYSLGVLLYELLVGETPLASVPDLDGGDVLSVWRAIRDLEPPRPSSRLETRTAATVAVAQRRGSAPGPLRRSLRGDLDWIVLKALARDRDERYDSVGDLADDLRRYLRHEAVEAGPPSALYRLRKAARRHRWALLAAGLVLLALLGGLGATAWGLHQARRAAGETATALARARTEAETARQVTELLVGLFQGVDPDGRDGARLAELTARELLDRGAERIDDELDGRPLVRSRLRYAVGKVYAHLGLWDQARELLERSRDERAGALETPDEDLAAIEDALGGLYRDLGELEQAELAYEKALAIRQRTAGPTSEEVASTLNNLAITHRLQGELGAARKLLERSLSVTRGLFGDSHRYTASVLNNLAAVSLREGDAEAARHWAEEAAAILRAELGPDHPAVGTVSNTIGLAARRLGDNRAAEAAYREDLRITSAALGDDHPAVAISRLNLAHVELALGRVDDAIGQLRTSERLLAERLGPEHPHLLAVRAGLGEALRRAGDFDSARRILADAVGSAGDDPGTAERRHALLEEAAFVERLAGRGQQSEALCRRVLEETGVGVGVGADRGWEPPGAETVGEGGEEGDSARAPREPSLAAARCGLQLALLAAAEGRLAGAEAWAAAALAEAGCGDAETPCPLDDPSAGASRAAWAAARGEVERALSFLELAPAAGSVEAWTLANPDLEALRGTDRYRRFARELEGRLGIGSGAAEVATGG